MNSKKLKYQAYLEKFPNCPPEEYQEVDMPAFRWVHKASIEEGFMPLHLSRYPPRMFDTEDENCMGYGLSMFNALDSAKLKFLKLKKQLQKDKGDSVAALKLENQDGLAGASNQQGHFTFHEYEATDLTTRITNVYSIVE
jgi:hypothetical protein